MIIASTVLDGVRKAIAKNVNIRGRRMREILFRGKSAEDGKWYIGQLLHFKSPVSEKELNIIVEGCEWDDSNEWFNLGISAKVVPETIGQYTGLTDKNGKKIFEGDIIRYADLYDYNCYLESIENPEVYDNIDLGNIWTIDEVVYGIKVGYPAFDLNKHDFETNGLSELSESGQYFYEVIGNIHDNPELLKGGEE